MTFVSWIIWYILILKIIIVWDRTFPVIFVLLFAKDGSSRHGIHSTQIKKLIKSKKEKKILVCMEKNEWIVNSFECREWFGLSEMRCVNNYMKTTRHKLQVLWVNRESCCWDPQGWWPHCAGEPIPDRKRCLDTVRVATETWCVSVPSQ